MDLKALQGPSRPFKGHNMGFVPSHIDFSRDFPPGPGKTILPPPRVGLPVPFFGFFAENFIQFCTYTRIYVCTDIRIYGYTYILDFFCFAYILISQAFLCKCCNFIKCGNAMRPSPNAAGKGLGHEKYLDLQSKRRRGKVPHCGRAGLLLRALPDPPQLL